MVKHFEQLKNTSTESWKVPALEDYKLMHRAASYKSMIPEFSDIYYTRPVMLDGTIPTDDQLIVGFQNYEQAKKNPTDFSEQQMNYFKECYDWCLLAAKSNKYKQPPSMPNGTLMSFEQMDTLEDQYIDLQRNHLDELTRLQQELKKQKRKRK